MNQEWWRKAIVYQVYPKSFKDSNNDGMGDLKGLISSLDYIKELGVNTLWLNPIFISPQIDNGYDISNYYAVDEIFGDMSDIEVLIEEAHKRELKIILDLVLNHTSSQHPWFQEAIKGSQNIYRDYYLWQNPSEKDGLPNNWKSFFGGSVWEKEFQEGQYYFHLFDKEMPDLNWHNPEVRHAMLEIALFWLEKGVDGFRLDAFIHMVKDDFSKRVEGIPDDEIVLAEEYYANLPEVKRYLSEFVTEIKEIKPDCFIIGQAASATPELGDGYIRDDLCDTVISFNHFAEKIIKEDSRLPKGLEAKTLDPRIMKNNLKAWQETLSNNKLPTLYWNNHDTTRMISSFGDEVNYRKESAKALATGMYLLKGIPIILYGEEIGMKNLDINDISTFQNPKAIEQYISLLENDFTKSEALKILIDANKESSRGAMQWNANKFAGFSTVPSWIGENIEPQFNVADASSDPTSILNFYKKLLTLKQTPLFLEGNVTFLEVGEPILAYKRKLGEEEAIVVVNLTKENVSMPEWLGDYHDWLPLLDTANSVNQNVLIPYDYKILKRKG